MNQIPTLDSVLTPDPTAMLAQVQREKTGAPALRPIDRAMAMTVSTC